MRALPLVLLLAGCAHLKSRPEALVDFGRMHPAAVVAMPYAGPGNVTGKPLYSVEKCALRQSVALRLQQAARRVESKGLRLKLFDCYRPLSVQRALWAVKPDERYVANPIKGSRHNRGAAVDLTLTDAAGVELKMPSAYDDFSEKAHRGQGSKEALENLAILDEAMRANGFVGLPTEWWHYDAKGWESFPLDDRSLESIP
jgi:D-alanyl-D-alanine dipeptidase